jgi:hypothetical protein
MNVNNPYGMSDAELERFDAQLAETLTQLQANRVEVADAWFIAAADDFGADFLPFAYLQALSDKDEARLNALARTHCDALVKAINRRLEARALELVNAEREQGYIDARQHEMRNRLAGTRFAA